MVLLFPIKKPTGKGLNEEVKMQEKAPYMIDTGEQNFLAYLLNEQKKGKKMLLTPYEWDLFCGGGKAFGAGLRYFHIYVYWRHVVQLDFVSC